jgi:Immunity protein 7
VYEFHGWFTLHESPDGDLDDELMEAALRDLAGYLEPFQARQLSAEVRVHNGQPF